MASYQNLFLKYFHHVLDHVKFSESEEEVNNISTETLELAKATWQKALAKDPRFKIVGIRSVGSMAEGSRLESPDEYDFMIILEHMDLTQKGFILQKGCRPGYVKLIGDVDILDSGKFRKRVLGYLQKLDTMESTSGNLKQVQRDMSVIEERFRGLVTSVIGDNETEAWNLEFCWKVQEKCKKISVDTMPAIQIDPDTLRELERREGDIFRSAKVRESLLGSPEGCFLVPKSCTKADQEERCGCWLVDFAPTEVKMIQNMMKVHKDCQKFLKFSLQGSTYALPSYMVKTAMLEHLEHCATPTESCSLKVLEYIMDCVDKAYMPESFMKDLNIFGMNTSDHFGYESPTRTAIFLEHFTRILNLFLQRFRGMEKIEDCDISNRTLEATLPGGVILHDNEDFYDSLAERIENVLRGRKLTLPEIRQETKPILSGLPWNLPRMEHYNEHMQGLLTNHPELKPLFQ